MKQERLEDAALLRALIYGDSGVGKTMLIGSACNYPGTTPLLVLNWGGQPISLRSFDPKPLVLTLESLADLNAPYRWLSENQPWGLITDYRDTDPFATVVYDYFKGEPGKFKMLAIDSITYIQRKIGDRIVGNADVLPGTMPKALESFGEWRQMLNSTVNIANRFLKLPLHVVLTALARHSEMPTTGITMYYPFLRGQSSLEVPSLAELVGRLISMKALPGSQSQAIKKASPSAFEEAWNVLITRSGRDYVAGWKGVADPPEYILAPTMSKIMEHLTSVPLAF